MTYEVYLTSEAGCYSDRIARPATYEEAAQICRDRELVRDEYLEIGMIDEDGDFIDSEIWEG